MKVRVGEESRTGRAIDLRSLDVDARTVAKAIRGEAESDCAIAASDRSVTIDCATPGPVHDHVGLILSSTTVSLRAALATVARSRGYTAPQADELAAVSERLDQLETPAIDLRSARKRVADASDVEAELRERVATLQGRVQALRETGDGPGIADTADTADAAETAEADLADATRRLSEVETERIAAEQALDRARERARAARETRRERLRLQDRAGNLRRAARDHLAEIVRESFEEAREVVPEGPEPSVRTALAVARVANPDAPVVLASGVTPFESVSEATRWLDAPVVGV